MHAKSWEVKTRSKVLKRLFPIHQHKDKKDISVGRAVSILWKRTRKGIINLVQDLCQFVKYIKKKHGGELFHIL